MKVLCVVSTIAFLWAPPVPQTCRGAVHWCNYKCSHYLDCEIPCADFCQSFLVSTPCGPGAQCGCTTSGPNSGPDVALVPPSGSGIGCPVGTCPNGDPPELLTGIKKTGPGRFKFISRAHCP
jgi:hypothetical protein